MPSPVLKVAHQCSSEYLLGIGFSQSEHLRGEGVTRLGARVALSRFRLSLVRSQVRPSSVDPLSGVPASAR
jgi:hypothetical protein